MMEPMSRRVVLSLGGAGAAFVLTSGADPVR